MRQAFDEKLAVPRDVVMQASTTSSATRFDAALVPVPCQSVPAASIANQPEAPAANFLTPRISVVAACGVSAQAVREPSASSANQASRLTPTCTTPARRRRGGSRPIQPKATSPSSAMWRS
jgi:hypothetical protein